MPFCPHAFLRNYPQVIPPFARFHPTLCSLLVSFRVFTGQHTAAQLPQIFQQLRAALLKQLEAALAAAKQVGGACVPLLPAEQASTAAVGGVSVFGCDWLAEQLPGGEPACRCCRLSRWVLIIVLG